MHIIGVQLLTSGILSHTIFFNCFLSTVVGWTSLVRWSRSGTEVFNLMSVRKLWSEPSTNQIISGSLMVVTFKSCIPTKCTYMVGYPDKMAVLKNTQLLCTCASHVNCSFSETQFCLNRKSVTGKWRTEKGCPILLNETQPWPYIVSVFAFHVLINTKRVKLPTDSGSVD